MTTTPHLAIDISHHTVSGREGPIPVRDYLPTESRLGAMPVLWIHGGAFSSGGLDQRESDLPARALAAAGSAVRTIDYRLVRWRGFTPAARTAAHPNQFPAALHDVVDTAADFADHLGTPIAIGGASAGACLAAAATLYQRDHDLQKPRALALAYGTFHAALPANDQIEHEITGLVRLISGPKMVHWMNLNYVRNPDALIAGYAFPGGADLTAFPPAMMIDAHNDRFRASGHQFAHELRTAGVSVDYNVLPGTRHGFLNNPRSAGYVTGIDRLKEWARAAL